MTDNNIGDMDLTEESLTETQVPAAKTYTQDEVDNMMARMKGSLQKKLLKPYEDLGDPDELRQLRQQAEKNQHAEALKRGEFDKVMQDLAAKKDAEIMKRDAVIKEYKVNAPLINAAAKHRAVAPEQVKQLLGNFVRLNEDGDVEVVDDKGTVRYNDKGQLLGVEDLVQEFLLGNPHFAQATPATTNTKSASVGMSSTARIDLANLDLTRPDHRQLYAQAKAKGQI